MATTDKWSCPIPGCRLTYERGFTETPEQWATRLRRIQRSHGASHTNRRPSE